MPKTFLEIAWDAINRGISIVPLHPRSKAAVERQWQDKGYSDVKDLDRFAAQNPDYGAGALCSLDGTWIFDVDSVEWLMDSFPPTLMPSLETFAVKTGGGGYQFHFKQDDLSRTKLSNKSIKNPNKDRYRRADDTLRETVADILHDRKQGLLPGCVHPDTGREYAVHKDLPIRTAAPELVDWLLSQVAKPTTTSASGQQSSPFKTVPGLDAESLLRASGLKFKKFEGGGKVYFNYHADMGRCLVRGASHAAEGERPNDRQSSFVWDPKVQHLWHQCFSASCEPGIRSTKKALAELSIDWRKVFASDGRVTIEPLRFSDFKKQHLRWLWQGYLPVNKLAHFAGNSTEGKSPVTVDLCARVSAGLPWPDGSPNPLGPRKVVLMAAEDDPCDTILPRLELAGAMTENVLALKASITKNMNDSEKAIALDQDMEALLEAMHGIKGLALVVMDPITNYLGRASMNKEEEVRSILMPLSLHAAEAECCIVTVGHLNKRDAGTSPKQRIMGAAAFHGVARFLYLFGPDPEDADKFAHVMVQDRGVGSPTLRYRTVASRMSWDGEDSDVVRVEWRGVSEATGEDAVNPASSKSKSEEAEAGAMLHGFLKSGRKPAQECASFMRDGGFPLDMGDGRGGMNSARVRKRAGAKAEQKDKKWWWFLPAGPESGSMF